jgi:NAD(P)-dependent dehydrogenase (short-subunit alcohol dehydrogenase family)
MGWFNGKVALITGGNGGIGRAAAMAFAREGAQVVIIGRRQVEGEATVDHIKAAGGDAIFVQADLTREADTRRMVDQTLAHYGRLDMAFNNAGNEGQPGPLIEQTEHTWNHTIDGNLKSTWLSMKYEIPAMLQHGGGTIVNNDSAFGHVGAANFAAYVAAKHGVVGLTKAAALEYATAGVRINSVSPGAIATEMGVRVAGSLEGYAAFMTPNHPIGRIGRAEEVAEAVLWLCSDSASFVTGQAIGVDGGYTAQ